MYKLTNHASITRLADNASIPNDPANVDYQQYLSWVAQGNTPAPFIAPPPTVPQVVTMRQARLALLGSGILGNVETALSSIPDPAQRAAATIEWEYSANIDRNSLLVSTMAVQMGLTSADLDALFITASTL